jgi:hypothetical protein
MVVLVRALGIPARVAVGFATGHSDGRGGYTITTADAHAWPEVWFQGLGWVRFEPTPRSDGTASPPAYTFQPVGGAGSTGGPSTPGTSTSTNRNGAPLPFADRGDASTDPGTLPALDPTQAQPADHTRGLLLEIVGLVLVGAAATPAVVRVLIRRRRISRRARAGAGSWREVLDTLVDVGIALPVSETPRGVARRLTASTGLLDGPAAEALWALATDEERRRYAPASSPGAAGATGAAGDVRRVRSGLLAASTRWQRVVAAVAPRSVLIRVRARVPAAVADGLDAGDRLLAAVAGRLPRVAGR